MPDSQSENQRLDFRQDDVIRMKAVRLQPEQYEAEMHRTGVRGMQPGMLQQLAGCEGEGYNQPGVSPDMARMLGMLEAKLNYLIGVNLLQQTDLSELEDQLVNISTTGMRFTSDERYKQGDHVLITVHLPVFPPVVLDLLARVVHSQAAGKGKYHTGVSFIYRSEEEEDTVTRYIFKRHREMIRVKYRQGRQRNQLTRVIDGDLI